MVAGTISDDSVMVDGTIFDDRVMVDSTTFDEVLFQLMALDESVTVGGTKFDESVIINLLLKEFGSARLRESDIHPVSSKTPAPQYQPIDRKKRKGKILEDYSMD